MKKKIKIFRVITQKEVVEWHLKNFLDRCSIDFDVFVLGNNVSHYKNQYQNINFIDITIKRKINIFSDLYVLISLAYYMIKYKPIVVHSIMPKAGLLSSISGFITLRPVRIHTFTGQVWANYNGVQRKNEFLLQGKIKTTGHGQAKGNTYKDNTSGPHSLSRHS